ncbi:hypothetical protein Tco_1400555 [Tanacetum coccineum]
MDTNSQYVQDIRIMFKDMVSLLEAAEVFKKANYEGEKWEKNNPESPVEEKDAQHPDQTKGEQDSGATTIAINKRVQRKHLGKKQTAKTSTQETDVLNFIIINSITNSSKTTSSIFSPTPPRELTSPRDEFKGKGIATEEPLKDIMPFMEEGGSVPKISSLKSFVIPKGPLSQEKTQKMTEHEAKRQNMLDEYNHQISFKVDQLPITKISYVVNPNKEATMKITKGDNPLNLISLRTKFQWVINQAKKLGLPPPPTLATFGMTAEDKKRKRTEFLKEVFVTENIIVDGMQRNLIPPLGSCQSKALSSTNLSQELIMNRNQIKVDSEITDEMFRKMMYVIEARNSDVMKGLSECKAPESNIRRIRVKDIVKEVERYLRHDSSTGMDIIWLITGRVECIWVAILLVPTHNQVARTFYATTMEEHIRLKRKIKGYYEAVTKGRKNMEDHYNLRKKEYGKPLQPTTKNGLNLLCILA